MNRRVRSLVDAHTVPIIRAVKVIVAAPVFVVLSPHARPTVQVAAIQLPHGRYIELGTKHRRDRLWLGFRVSLLIVPAEDDANVVDIVPDGYAYQILAGDGRTQFDEIMAYHWTPNDPSAKCAWPHLHIGSAFIDSAARREPLTLHKTHFLTGPISAAGFVRMAVEEFGVQPVVADWLERLVEDGVRP